MLDLTHYFQEDDCERVRAVIANDQKRAYWRAKALEYDDLEQYPYEPPTIPPYQKPNKEPFLKKSYGFAKEIISSLAP